MYFNLLSFSESICADFLNLDGKEYCLNLRSIALGYLPLLDSSISHFSRLYKSDKKAMKVASHELRALNAIASCDVSGLYFPLMSIIGEVLRLFSEFNLVFFFRF